MEETYSWLWFWLPETASPACWVKDFWPGVKEEDQHRRNVPMRRILTFGLTGGSGRVGLALEHVGTLFEVGLLRVRLEGGSSL